MPILDGNTQTCRGEKGRERLANSISKRADIFTCLMHYCGLALRIMLDTIMAEEILETE